MCNQTAVDIIRWCYGPCRRWIRVCNVCCTYRLRTKITGSELISAVNTNTTYLLGNNLSFDLTTTPDTINLDTTLTSMVKISSPSGNFEIGSENKIKF